MSELQVVEKEVSTVAQEVVEKVEEVAKAAIVQITTEEKLVARELELEYLKLTMQIQSLQKQTEEKSRAYQANVEGWLKKYGLTHAEYMFDATQNAFKKL